MAMSMDYAQMVEGCRRRDPKAQRALYDAVSQMSMGICMRYAQGRDEAQDMMQDGFVRVFEHIGGLRDTATTAAWVRKVMLNVCLNHIKVDRRMLRGNVEVDDVADVNTDPYAMEEIVAAIQKLAPQQRVVFNMVEVEGFELKETAQRLHCSEVNVRALLCRAKKALREKLKE